MQKNSTTYRQLILLAVSFLLQSTLASAQKISVLAREDADKVKTRLVLYNDRVCPLNTLALDFTSKLTGSTTYQGLSAEQLLLSIPYAPELWSEQELLHIDNATLREKMGITTQRARVKDFFTQRGEYRLKQLLDQEDSKPASAQDAALIDAIHTADEQIALFEANVKGRLIQPYSGTDVSMTLIKAEILYNRIKAIIPPISAESAFPIGIGTILAILGFIIISGLWKEEKTTI